MRWPYTADWRARVASPYCHGLGCGRLWTRELGSACCPEGSLGTAISQIRTFSLVQNSDRKIFVWYNIASANFVSLFCTRRGAVPRVKPNLSKITLGRVPEGPNCQHTLGPRGYFLPSDGAKRRDKDRVGFRDRPRGRGPILRPKIQNPELGRRVDCCNVVMPFTLSIARLQFPAHSSSASPFSGVDLLKSL